jgi:beta-phosphoglucomutase-like phosphatase (HAD superfamily)
LTEKGYILTIATTTRRNNVNVYRTRNEKIRNKADLDTYFRLVYTREDAKEIKPNPEIYLRVMEELGVTAEECLVFEDSLIGIEAAKNAGIESVAVYDPYSDGEREQINALADYQIQSYTELLRVLQG